MAGKVITPRSNLLETREERITELIHIAEEFLGRLLELAKKDVFTYENLILKGVMIFNFFRSC